MMFSAIRRFFAGLGWYLRQLLPLTYRTVYGDEKGAHFCVWRMWLGRCFDVDDVIWDKNWRPDMGLTWYADRSVWTKGWGCE